MTKRQFIEKNTLVRFYIHEKKSSAEIAKRLDCSENKINYWLKKHTILKRNISEAIYVKKNQNGDPFIFRLPQNIKEGKLFGLGVGLYWGEGTKANKNTVRLGNSDPYLLKKFMEFMDKFFNVKKNKFKFHLHTFSDINLEEAFSFWMRNLGIKRNQFYKPTVTITGKLGNYRKKSKYGVLTLYFSNIKLRNIIVGLIDDIK